VNDSITAQARQQTLGDLPRRTARRFPDKPALVDGDTRLSFAELDAVVDRTAGALHELGLRKGDRLALLSHNCWQFAVLSFATARIGVVLVPINFMLGADEIAYILDHSEASVFVVEDALVETGQAAVEASSGTVRATAALCIHDAAPAGSLSEQWTDAQAWFDHDGPAPEVLVGDDDPVRLMYTSGTESRPKGAMLSSRSLMWQYVSCVVDGGMEADDVEVHSLPLYHCAQLDCFLGPDIYLGATSVIVPAPDPATLLRTIETERVTKLFAPPTVWISLLRAPEFDSTDLSSLRKGYYGASAMPVEVLHEIRERLPEVRLWNFYGQTEMAPLATILGPEEQLSHAGSAGRAALNVETLVVDDQDNPVPPGTVGEIVHRSPHAMLGYYKDEARTAEAFRNGWFHSGDLGVLDEDGRLAVVDRKKDMIKTGGENVASREVEEAIYQLEGVAEVAVFGVDHPAGSRRWWRSSYPSPGPRSPPTTSSRTPARTWPATRRPSTWSSPTPCRRTPAARSSSGSCASSTPRSRWRRRDGPAPRPAELARRRWSRHR
jgi:fatty-acyl-CoA synthase